MSSPDVLSQSQHVSKDGWQRVKFGDIAEHISDRVDDPTQAGVDHYVGLEHLDPESLKIRRWGTPDDVEATKLRFKPGDIIFGKRRAYQRKVAVAEFEGICSAHAMVLRAREENVVKELLPFFMQSEQFFQRAIAISEGSLSPTIKWKALAQQEFALPPKDEQSRIADILWTLENLLDAVNTARKAGHGCQDAVMADFLRSGLSKHYASSKPTIFGQIPDSWLVLPISEIADVAYGISEAVASNNDPALGWPILTGANITLDGAIDLSKINYIEEPSKEGFILKRGDLLLNWRSGSSEHVGKTAIFDLDGSFTYASFLLRIRANESVDRVYLHRLLNFIRRRNLFGASISQQVNFKMNAAFFRNVLVVVPPLEEQLNVVRVLKAAEACQRDIACHILSTARMKQELLKQLLQSASSRVATHVH